MCTYTDMLLEHKLFGSDGKKHMAKAKNRLENIPVLFYQHFHLHLQEP